MGGPLRWEDRPRLMYQAISSRRGQRSHQAEIRQQAIDRFESVGLFRVIAVVPVISFARLIPTCSGTCATSRAWATSSRFNGSCAARPRCSGELLNVADVARDADVAPNTARSWLSILETSGLVYLLPPWHGNLGKRLLKTPKLYFLDTGLCAYLTQWSSPETLEAGAMSGAILESWVVAEILKSYWHQGRLAPFHYYRDKDQCEIDLVIEADGVLYAVEIKKTASPGGHAARGGGARAARRAGRGGRGDLPGCPTPSP